MNDLKDALASLQPIEFTSVPTADSELSQFLSQAFTYGEVAANSIPLTQTSDEPPLPTPNTATKASETTTTFAQVPSLQVRHSDLQKPWGKPMKMSVKDNPLGVSVFKMAGYDRKGAWFARRSVHYGIGFERFRMAMQREFLESLAVKKGPGSGAVRSIAGDRRIEQKIIEGVGKLEVWQLSSAFPGPVTPREFVTLLLTSDCALSKASAPEEAGVISPNPPRHFMVISRPTSHSEAPPRKELVRGQYESVELIREVPLHPSRDSEDAKPNPVEWIMVTRSDAGGGIPKFMVERGTPGAIVADVPKFFDWACGRDYSKDKDQDLEQEREKQQDTATTSGVGTLRPDEAVELHDRTLEVAAAIPLASSSASESHTAAPRAPPESEGSIISNLANAVNSYVPYFNHQSPNSATANDHDDSSSSISTATASSAASFASAKEINSKTTAPAPESPALDSHVDDPSNSIATPSSTNPATTEDSEASTPPRPRSQHERELLKLTQQRLSLDRKISKAQLDDSKKAAELLTKDEKERAKAVEKHDRERRKQKDKFEREAEKLEQRRDKEEKRMEERRMKAREKDVLGRVGRDRDEWRERCGVAEREVEVLRRRVEVVERENAGLVAAAAAAARSGEGEGEREGELVRLARVEAGRVRTASTASRASARSNRKGVETVESKNEAV